MSAKNGAPPTDNWTEKVLEDVRDWLEHADDRAAAVNAIRALLHELSPGSSEPVDYVRWVPVEKVSPNDYNPNAVAHQEMTLLLRSIEHDGFTQPVVTIYDPDQDVYVIVDGFHRYFVTKSDPGINERTGGLLPIVVIEKDVNQRMAATVRHNRARGKHSVTGMGNMVFAMLENGMSDLDVCKELGLEAEELLKLKHITGFSYLYQDHDYNRSWVTKSQIDVARQHGVSLADE